jgi:4-hydroxy-tetrahydrodipicolinate synthase
MMKLAGSVVALVTPMQQDGAIDFEALSRLIEWQISSRTAGILVAGSTGESLALTEAERHQLITAAVNAAKGRIPIIAGTGTAATQTTIAFTQAAESAGADAALIVTPYYTKPTPLGLYQHYQAVAASSTLPIFLYNIPGRTGVDLLPETIARLGEIKNIIGIKEATGNLERAKAILQLLGPDFLIFSGDDATALTWMLNSCAKGVVSVTANVAPALMQAMCEKAIQGEVNSATQLNDQLSALHKDLFLESNPIPTKWALQKMGKIQSGIRSPLTTFSAQHHQTLERTLQQAGVFEETHPC